MSQYTAPDGTVFNIPSDPAKKEQLSNALKKVYPGANIYEPTLGGRAVEFGKAIPRGGLATLASAIKGPVALFDVGDDSDLYKGITDFEKYLQEDSALAPEAGYEDLYSTKLGGAFGSFVPFLGAGVVGGALAKAGTIGARAGQYGVPLGLAVPAGMGQQADLIEASRGLGEEVGGFKETVATLLGGAIGATEIMPVANILKKVPRKALEDLPTKQLILEYMKSAAQSGTFEGAQEVAASLLQNMVARGLYSDELPLIDSVFEEFTLGGIVGGTADLVFNSMQKRRGIATHEEGERAERAKVDSNKLIEAKKAELAEQQGVLPVIQDQPFKVAPNIPAPVEPAIAPDLQIIENTDSTFSLLDQNNLENPVIKTVPTQAEALAENKKVKDAFAQKQIIQQLNNDLYSQGLINSSTAYRIGDSLLNPNSISVGINTIIKYDPKAKNKTLKEYREELETAGTYNKLPFQNQYTIADAQKLLNKSQFNNFASDAAAKIFETSEKNGIPSIRDGKQTINTSRKYIKDFAAGKNIELDFDTPAVRYAAKLYTGTEKYSNMSKGQKELFLAKLHSLPSFNVKTPFPNFAPRAYSAKDTADFVATIGSTEFTGKDVQNFLADREISTLAASDFLRDLDQSGRAQFVKGKEKGFLTSVRQIRPNFEFDIARRAEGFNESPEEFRARLERQGELKPEVIEQMVQNETARQEPYTPPKQLEEQTINFAEAIEEGRTNKFAKELRKSLDARGLKDTGIVVSNDILSTSVLKEQDGQIAFDPRITRETAEEGAVEGEYDKNTDIIFLSLNAVNPDGNATDAEIQTRLNKILDHEMIHALRAKDLITESEYRYLKNLVKNRRVPQAVDAQAFEKKETFYDRSKRINKGIEKYGASANKKEEIYIEEAIAELFRAREVVAKDVPPKAKGIYNKIVQFFQSIGNAMKISGYNKAADIFQDIEAGRVGARARGEIRTLRDLDQAGRAQAQVVTDYEDDAETPTGPVVETKVKPTSPRPLAFDPRSTPTTPPVATPPVTPPVTPPITPPVATPPSTPEAPEADIPRETTPDSESIPNTIYDSSTRSREDKAAERKLILDGLSKAGVIKGKTQFKGIARGETIAMVKWLKDNAPSKDYEILASKALEKLNRLKNKGLTFPFQIGGLRTTQGYVRYAPFGTQFAMRINDNDLGSTGVDFETLLHETFHSTTQYQINLITDNNRSASRRGKRPKGVSAKEFAAFKELDAQRERVLKEVDKKSKQFNETFDTLLKEMRGDSGIANIYEVRDKYNEYINGLNLGYIWTKFGEAIGSKKVGETGELSNWNSYYVKYMIEGRQNTREKSNSSEFISWGMTNRNFQEFLENIPLTSKKTAWSKFVETIRTILNLPARLDTELSAFLHNAADVIGGTEVVTTEPRAPPETKKGEIPFATRPTKVILTKPFTYIKAKPEEAGMDVVYHNGELNDFKLQIFKFDDGSWSLESPAEQIINGVTLKNSSITSIDLSARNKKEAVAQVKKLWEELLRTGSYTYGVRGENKLILDEGVTLNEARQDVPTFSRISKRGELDNRIADLDRRIEIKENTLRQDGQYLGTASYNRMSNEIDVLKGQRARLVEERNNLPPEQVPLFSRAQDIGSPLNEPLGYRLNDRTLQRWLKYHNYENLNERPGAPRTEGEIDAAYRKNDPALNESYAVYPDRVETFFAPTGDKLSKKTYKNPTHRQLLVDFDYIPRTQEDVPLFSRASLTPKQSEMPILNREDFSSFGREEVGKIYSEGIFDQLEGSRLGGTREKPGALKVAITNGLKNKKIQEASKNFLQQFTNSRGNLILFRSLNIPENENIRNYGQLPEDNFASTTLNPREAQAIGRNLFNRAYNAGATWNTEILRYEVPMDKVIGYVPTLIQAMRSNYLDTYTSNLAGSGYRSREEIEEEQAEMDEAGDFYYQEEQSIEELLDDENYKLDEYINEAEVVADLRGIKPTYQYSPKTRAREEASITRDIPLFSRASRNFSDGNSNESIKRREAVKIAEERTKETPRGDIPFYNMNASDIALEAAIEFNQDPLKTAPDDIPTFSRAMPSNLQEAADTVGVATPKQSQATRLIDFASNPVASIKKQFKDFRTNYIDKLDAIEKRIVKGSAENEEVRLANNTADTATVAAISMADRARGIFQQMLLKGIPVDQIEGMPSLTKVIDLVINTRYNPLIEGDTSTGGLMQILSALQSDPEVDLEGVFSLYAKLKRVKKLNERGEEIASPITSKELQAIETIEREHPVVVEAYNNYQKWNNALVDFASRKGLLDSDQAAKWIEHSSYYPFYRTMVDDANITAPTIAGGSLPNNPLNMPMKGSEEKIDVDPIEAISRNSLSILTAAMKNDGTMKLLRDLESLGEARVVSNTKLAGINSVFVFENGNKKHYQVDDIDTYMAMQSIGGVKSDGLMKILAMPAGLLRDTVTRDPGFVFVNVFRDTISAAVTSGAPLGSDGFTPIIDSFKNLFGDISSLEEFGVIGGYDFANDEGDVKDFLNRARRRAGLSPNNGLRPDVAFYKLWDGLGNLTTKSDGATRKAVADAVYKKLKKSIDPVTGKYYTEAQAQSEAAYQGLEIINFGRRGQSSMFRVLTTAIPFLNARVQGLDVLYRSFSGKYSAQDKLQEGGTLEDLQGMIMRRALMRLAVMVGTTAMYYALVSDTDEYKAEKLEKRDDNYIIPIGGGNVIYLPIAFEVGMLTKAIPERLFDLMSGEDAFSDTSLTDFKDSTVRQLSNSLNLPFLGGDIGIQAFKPIFEAVTNRASFTNSEIVPYFMAKEKPAYQSRESTNEIFRMMGEALNISPIKLEYIFKGYTGTLGGYALTITDALARSVTGTPLMPPNIKQIPVVGRFVGNQERMGGLQQQFYKLREEVNTAVTTMNSLREDGRMDELYAYRNQVQGLLNAKGQVRAIERYMRNWRKRRDRILNRTDNNANVRSDMLLDLQIERDKRLAMIPELRQKADIPPDTVGVILR